MGINKDLLFHGLFEHEYLSQYSIDTFEGFSMYSRDPDGGKDVLEF